MQRVIAYVDGFNLYHGIRDSKWSWAKWPDTQQMVQCLLRQGQDLVHVHYFTSRVDAPAKKRRQIIYLEALGTLAAFSIHYGRFLSDEIQCTHCGHMLGHTSGRVVVISCGLAAQASVLQRTTSPVGTDLV